MRSHKVVRRYGVWRRGVMTGEGGGKGQKTIHRLTKGIRGRKIL